MNPAVQQILNTASHSMHFAGKLDGHVLMLIEAPGNVCGSHAVLLATPTVLHQLPVMPEAKAREAFWSMARKLASAS